MAEHSAKGKIARPVKNNIFAKTRNKPLERWIRGLLVFKTLIPPSKGTIINNVKQKPIKDTQPDIEKLTNTKIDIAFILPEKN